MPITNIISNINNTQTNNAENENVLMSMYKLIKHSDNYSKRLRGLWQVHRDPNDNLTESESFKSKIKITRNTCNDENKKHLEIAFPLKNLSNFWRALEIPSIDCEISLSQHAAS